jgi:hypothetical protein
VNRYNLNVKYKISNAEIIRRKNAYITFSISLIIGLFLSSMFFNFPTALINCYLTIGVMFIIGFFSFRFFRYLLQTKVLLSKESLVRINNQLHEEYSLGEISRVKIKWTTNNTIREIYIWLNDKRSIFVAGLDNFEQFRKDLLGKLGKDIVVKEVHEFLDFDHLLFYPALGLTISIVGILSMKLIASFNFQNMQILLSALFVYLFILGIYFIIARPISKRLNNQKKAIDYLSGLTMIGTGIFIFILGLE